MISLNLRVLPTEEPCTCGRTPSFTFVVAIGASEDTAETLCMACASTRTIPLVLDEAPVAKEGLSPKERKKFSQKGEEATAKVIGGRRHKGSGCIPGLKGDVRLPMIATLEEKFTMNESFRVTLSDLLKIKSETPVNEIPGFIVKFHDKHTGTLIDSWICTHFPAFLRLIQEKK